MPDLKITLVQTPLVWHNTDANLHSLAEKISAIPDGPDIIILPEMFSTGFTMDVNSQGEAAGGKTLEWMKLMSSKSDAALIGSYIVNENERYYNRLHCISKDGNISIYDKRHLFRMANEHQYFDEGKDRIIVKIKGWKIMPLICYDLRFPVWSRNRLVDGEPAYDLLLYVANWPAARISAWDALLKARAIENLAYCIGVNRTGSDGNGIDYNGHSACYGPKGEIIHDCGENEGIHTFQLHFESLMAYREKFPAFMDGDTFTLPN